MNWPNVGETLESKTGRAYTVVYVDDHRFKLQRPGTQSLVVVTKAKCEKALALKNSGVAIKPRTLSYTVAIEIGILYAIGGVA